MPCPVRLARLLRALVALGALSAIALVLPGAPAAASPACAPGCLPHLVPLIPDTVTADQHAPIFVDLVEQPGHVLYRFDTVIQNTGGALDLFTTSPTSTPPWPSIAQNDVKQAVWTGGTPPAAPQDPNAAPTPSTPGIAAIEDRSAAAPGATIVYDPLNGHHHWHFLQAAQYELLVPGGAPIGSGKAVGFCMVDSYGPFTMGAISDYPETTGSTENPWCQPFQSPEDGGSNPVVSRMGISPGWGDYYESQDAGQWVDVTGLPPGTYTLRDTVNPNGFIDTSPPVGGDSIVEVQRVIPGVTAQAASQSVSGERASQIALSGAIVGPDIPARVSNTPPVCDDDHLLPTTPLAACYVTDAPNAPSVGPLHFALAQGPAHGQVAITDGGGLSGVATYTPAAGYAGPDSFTYTAADARGLVSAPATVNLSVSATLGGTPPPGGTRPPAGGQHASFAPKLILPAGVLAGRRFSLRVRLGQRLCGARITLLGARARRASGHHLVYRRLASRRFGCTATATLKVHALQSGTWSLRASVQVGGHRQLSAVRRLVVRRRR